MNRYFCTTTQETSSKILTQCTIPAGLDLCPIANFQKFARTVISKLARTNWKDDPDSQLAAIRGELRRAAALAFRFDPATTEALIAHGTQTRPPPAAMPSAPSAVGTNILS